MPQRIETITQHVFAFDDDEIARIVNALSEFGDHELADAIYDELPDAHNECEDGNGDSGLDSFVSECFDKCYGSKLSEIYNQCKEGRIIIASSGGGK